MVCTSIYWYIKYIMVYTDMYTCGFTPWKRVASGTHYAPELLRLPLDTAKGCQQCQGTIHNMRLQNMIQLSCGPPGAWASSHIALVRKTQRFLKVLQSILPAWWAASPEQGGWICKYIPASLERNTNDAQRALAEPGYRRDPGLETRVCWA